MNIFPAKFLQTKWHVINTHEDSHPLRVKYKNITLFIEFKIEYKKFSLWKNQ